MASASPSEPTSPAPAPAPAPTTSLVSDSVDFDFKLCDRLTSFYPALGDNFACTGALLLERRMRGALDYDEFARCLTSAAVATDVDRCVELHPRPATPSDESLCQHIVRVTIMKLATESVSAADVAALQQECLAGLTESRAELSSEEYLDWKNCVILLDDYEAMQQC